MLEKEPFTLDTIRCFTLKVAPEWAESMMYSAAKAAEGAARTRAATADLRDSFMVFLQFETAGFIPGAT
jgi:hypothetical protein